MFRGGLGAFGTAFITGGQISGLTSLALTTGAILSGTYTPTLTNTTNVAASAAYATQYMRVGAVVTVSGKVDIDPTSASVTTAMGISLPVATDFTGNFQLGGTAATNAVAGYSAAIYADTVNDRATLEFVCGTDVVNHVWFFTFTYLIA